MRPMRPKTILYTVVAVCAAVFAVFPPNHLTAQSDTQSAAISAALLEVQTQQATLADNQKQIDAKLANIGETLRVARIFTKRGGGAK